LNKSNTHDKFYNLISFAEKDKLKLGRKHDTDIRISDDISVSRNHATVTFDPKTSEFIL
jgi:pSer/pThr/pTyr-binding forkhead associated (FHA) protein